MQGKPPPWRPPFSSRLQLVLSNDPVDHRAVLRELRLEPRSDLPFGQRSANYEFPMHLKSNFSTAGLFLLNLAIYTDSQDSWSLMRCRTVQTAFCNYSPSMSVKNPHKSNLKMFWHSRSIVKIHNICTYIYIYLYMYTYNSSIWNPLPDHGSLWSFHCSTSCLTSHEASKVHSLKKVTSGWVFPTQLKNMRK